MAKKINTKTLKNTFKDKVDEENDGKNKKKQQLEGTREHAQPVHVSSDQKRHRTTFFILPFLSKRNR